MSLLGLLLFNKSGQADRNCGRVLWFSTYLRKVQPFRLNWFGVAFKQQDCSHEHPSLAQKCQIFCLLEEELLVTAESRVQHAVLVLNNEAHRHLDDVWSIGFSSQQKYVLVVETLTFYKVFFFSRFSCNAVENHMNVLPPVGLQTLLCNKTIRFGFGLHTCNAFKISFRKTPVTWLFQ